MDFQTTKSLFIDSITRLITIGNDIKAMHIRVNLSNKTLKSVFTDSINEDFDKHLALLKTIIGIIERNKMKCVLFGKTSNGKSAVINALLGEKILPSRMGRTTSCFISVSGCDEDEGYLKIDVNNQRQNLILLNEMASQLSENKCNINRLLKVYSPKSKCRLLENDLEILDSPGVDYSKEHDDWITRYCEDADVFILVIDGCGTLNDSEKSCSRRITEKISKPNILVIVNKWDLVEQDDGVELIKKQHIDDISHFLCDELKLYDVNSVPHRIYFVSSKKELENKGTQSFKEFEQYFGAEISRNAVNTKFKPHVDNIRLAARRINDVVNKFLDRRKTQVNDTKQMLVEIQKYVSSAFEKMIKETKTQIDSNETYLAHNINRAVLLQIDFEKDTINFLETDFIHQLSFIFSNNLQTLEKQIIEKFVERCCTDVKADQMKIYFTGNSDLSCFHKKYKEELMIHVHNSTSQIRNSNKENEDDFMMFRGAVIHIKSVLSFICLLLTVVVPLPPAKVVFALGSGLVGYIPDPSTENIVNTIVFEFTRFYNSITDHFIDQFKTEISQRIERSLTKYLKHQDQLLESFECFKDNISRIIAQISNIINEDHQ